jgi:hypothetical protein
MEKNMILIFLSGVILNLEQLRFGIETETVRLTV